MRRHLTEYPNSTKDIEIQEGYGLKTLIDKISYLIESGDIHNFREGGSMIAIHTLAKEVAKLQDQLNELKLNKK